MTSSTLQMKKILSQVVENSDQYFIISFLPNNFFYIDWYWVYFILIIQNMQAGMGIFFFLNSSQTQGRHLLWSPITFLMHLMSEIGLSPNSSTDDPQCWTDFSISEEHWGNKESEHFELYRLSMEIRFWVSILKVSPIRRRERNKIILTI